VSRLKLVHLSIPKGLLNRLGVSFDKLRTISIGNQGDKLQKLKKYD